MVRLKVLGGGLLQITASKFQFQYGDAKGQYILSSIRIKPQHGQGASGAIARYILSSIRIKPQRVCSGCHLALRYILSSIRIKPQL